MSKIPPKIDPPPAALTQAKTLKEESSKPFPSLSREEKKSSLAFKEALHQTGRTTNKPATTSSKTKIKIKIKIKEAKPQEAKPQETKPHEAKPHGAKPQQEKPLKERTQKTKPQETKSQKTRPQETKSQKTKPQETKPQETRPQETRPQETKSQDAKPQKAIPHETAKEIKKENKTKSKEKTPLESAPPEALPLSNALPSAAPPLATAAAAPATKIDPLKTEQMIQVIEKSSSRLLLARSKDPGEIQIRMDLHDSLLPNTTLTMQKSPDGGLALTFTTDHPESQALLGRLEKGLGQHLAQTQSVPFHIQATSSQGQTFLQTDVLPNRQDGAAQQQNNNPDKKPDWESVEDRLKEGNE